jgi:hypothetical protein
VDAAFAMHNEAITLGISVSCFDAVIGFLGNLLYRGGGVSSSPSTLIFRSGE